jgi:hypothetical protein
MSGKAKDIDPASDLVEEDEEATLPEAEPLLDLEGETPLAAGRAALIRHAKLAPSSPGVYRMLDAAGEVLYVGKAKSIRKRIVAYTRPTGHDTRIERVIAATASVEFVSTATETEALLLEANLIKRLRPRFNVLLRDVFSHLNNLTTDEEIKINLFSSGAELTVDDRAWMMSLVPSMSPLAVGQFLYPRIYPLGLGAKIIDSPSSNGTVDGQVGI